MRDPSPDIFAFGWYAVGGQNPPVTEPWNLILIQGKDTTLLDQLDGIALQSMYAIVQVNDYDTAAGLLQKPKVISHRALYAWYLYDEPDLTVPQAIALPATLERIYSLITTQGKRPVAINFAGANATNVTGTATNAEAYKNAMDICMEDAYPITVLNEARQPAKEFDGLSGWTSLAYNPLLVYPPWVIRMRNLRRAAVAAGKPFYAVLQAYGSPGTVIPNDYPTDMGGHKLPTADEQRYMAYTAIQEDAKGLFFWAPGDGDPVGDTGGYRNNTINVLLREIQANIYSFASGESGALTTSETTVKATIYKDVDFGSGDGYVLLLIHHGNGNVNTAIAFQDPRIHSSEMIVITPDNPALPPVNGGMFRTALDPYEVRIYKFSLKPVRTDVTPAAAGRRNNLFVFIKALDRRILFNQAAPSGAFVGWQEVPGGLLTDTPLGVGMQADTLFVFAKASDGRIFFNQAASGGAFVGWQSMANAITDVAPAVAGRQNNLFVFIKALDGRILFNQAAPGGAFVGWQEVPGGLLTDAPLGVGMQADTLFVFAKASDGRILFNQAASGGAFVGWQTMADALTDVAPAAAGRQNNLFVFIKALDGRILFNQAAPGGAFVGWQEVPGGLLTDAPLGVGMQADTLFVFAKASDGRILFNQAAPGGAFVGWQRVPDTRV